MCGRFTLRTPTAVLLQTFEVEEAPEFPLRYNVAPTQDVLAVRCNKENKRQLAPLHWGLVPYWAKEPTIASRMINARSESVAEKPAFREAFKFRRCLILTDGYFKWLKIGSRKQPYYIHRKDDRPFAFAGLWERWKGMDPPLESCTIITTDSNELTRFVHDRMPVILPESEYDLWLDPALTETERLQELLVPFDDEQLRIDKVSMLVNSVRNDVPECIEVQRELF